MNQKQKSEQTKELILNTAFKLFYENGFKTTSIDKIMKAAQLTKGAFYHHYKNKKELGVAVISLILKERVYKGMISPLYQSGDALNILKTTFIDRLKSFSLYEKQHGCPLNNFINEVGDKEVAYQMALKRVIEEWKTALVYLVEKGKKEKSIQTTVSSKAIAIYLISSFEGFRGLQKLYNDDSAIEEYLSGLSLYLNQIRA